MPGEPASSERRDGAFPKALGKYIPLARLGSGGMAEVFLSVARGPMGFNKLVVLKRLRSSDNETHVEMFLDEARLAARLNHPNIVHTYEVGETDGYFIAMEYLEGQSLQALLRRLSAPQEGLSEPLVAYIAAQVLKGLHHAHDACDFDGTPLGIVHRDVSPQNLYLTYGGEVKVLDFGIAKARMNSTQTETGVLKGKVRYMAPEQLGPGPVDRRADVFAFGVVLWELLARRPLFQGDAASVMSRVLHESVPSVRSVRPEASSALDLIAMKALERDPNERYATADEMRVALEDFLRETGHLEVERELGRLMNELFAQTRDEVRGRIKVFLEKLPPSGGPAPRIPRTRDLPALLEGSEPHTPPAMSRTAEAPTRVSRWSWLLLVIGSAVVGVMGLARLGQEIQVSRGVFGGPGVRPEATGIEPGLDASAVPGEALRPGPPALPAPSTVPLASVKTAESSTSPPPSSAPLPAGVAPAHEAPRPAASQRPHLKIRVLDDDDSP